MPQRFPTNPDIDGAGGTARLVSLEFFEVELRVDGIVWLKRNWVAYETTADIHRAYDEFLHTVDDWKLERRIALGQLGTRTRTNIAWLYDLRHAPTQRNDPEFEAAILARRPHLLARSPFLVVLVKTAAGRMQLNRLFSPDRAQMRVSDDFSASIEWLKKQLAAVPSSRT
jgi:hypothetical protein